MQDLKNTYSKVENSWLQNPSLQVLPIHLSDIMSAVFAPSGLKFTKSPQREPESAEYGACNLELDHKKMLFRVAHTTPTKTGQFVTLWKRQASGEAIAPIDASDGIDCVLVCVFDPAHKGLFIFNKNVLVQKNIMSTHGKGGKRGLRIYPPWTNPHAKQAILTQKWQLNHFLPLSPQNEVNVEIFHKLLNYDS